MCAGPYLLLKKKESVALNYVPNFASKTYVVCTPKKKIKILRLNFA